MKHRIDDKTWLAAGEAYLKGGKVTDICRRYGVSRSQFYVKADALGWRQPDEPATDGDLPERARPAVEMADHALAKACAAIDAGKLDEARGWTALAAQLRRMAMEEEGAITWRGAVLNADDREQQLFDLTTGKTMDEAADRTSDSQSDTDRTPTGQWISP
jgi:transposase-like protein